MANRSLSPSAPVIGSRYAEQKRSRSSPNDREPVDYGSPADAADDPATKAPDASRACPASATHRPEPTGPLSPPVLPILKKPTGSVVENSLLKQVLSQVALPAVLQPRFQSIRTGLLQIQGTAARIRRADTRRSLERHCPHSRALQTGRVPEPLSTFRLSIVPDREQL